MISVSTTILVNPPGEPVRLTREDVWHGLKLKAANALPYVPAMTKCEVVEQTDDVIIREIEFRGQEFGERITFVPQQQVRFERISGPVMGTILNDILEDDDGELELRFSFDLVLEGVEPGSQEERDYEGTMTVDYLAAVTSTVAAMRRMAAERLAVSEAR
ncbi:MAG TPA: SRPBCC family protein [Solirubrobacteraceae bacterium]|nr:SRPBCC family protein [Solirubrobacteraceae bacterium]